MEKTSENFILDSVGGAKPEPASDKSYFQDKLAAIKIAKKFGSDEEKAYFSDLEKAIKISLKYL
jgi:hypothetical protein